MKYCVLGEDRADEAGIRILVDGILGLTGTMVSAKGSLRRRSGGSGSVGHVLPSVLRELYYNTDAGGLVVVLDSDDTPIHLPSHDDPDQAVSECRLCSLRTTVGRTMGHYRAGVADLAEAVRLAPDSAEAWLRLCGARITWAAWAADRGKDPGEHFREARAAIDRSLRLDPTAAERLQPTDCGTVRAW